MKDIENLMNLDLIHQLVTKQLEASITKDEQQQLADAITSDSSARREYILYMQEMAHISSRLVCKPAPRTLSKSEILESCDRDSFVQDTCETSIQVTDVKQAKQVRRFHAWMIAAAVIIAVGLGTAFIQSREPSGQELLQTAVDQSAPQSSSLSAQSQGMMENGTSVATLIQSTSVRWDSHYKMIRELGRVSVGQELCINQGTLKLVFDSGVEALVLAPCLMKVVDRDKVFCKYGRIIAKAGETGKGFVVDTPVARVTDAGTEFGVTINDSGETEVAVFEGEVDVEVHSANEGNVQMASVKHEHLAQGEATLINHAGDSRRVFSIDSRRLPGVRDLAPIHTKSQVISSVRDNLSDRQPESRMFYRIVQAGLREDSQAFVDRKHQWNGVTKEGIPNELMGADYVMPFNDDKFADDLEVRVMIARPAMVYVFYNNNMPVPDWLSESFEDTGVDIGLDETVTRFNQDRELAVGAVSSVDRTFSIWKRSVDEPQELVLGSFERPDDVRSGYNMYGIAAVAKAAIEKRLQPSQPPVD